MRSTEDIILERIGDHGSKVEQTTASGDSMSQLSKPGAVLVGCRLCHMKGNHWTSRCPQKDLFSLMDQPVTAENCTPTLTGTGTGTGTGRGVYVPPSRRNGADSSAVGSDMMRNDENSVHVTNLMELFCPFGAVSDVM